MTKKEIALEYVSAGMSIFPCAPGSKIPLKGTRGLLDATTDIPTINSWWDEHPDANIAIATGNGLTGNGLMVVDIDPKNDGWTGFNSLREYGITFPVTYEVNTPSGGRHIYLSTLGPIRTRASIAPGVDIRGDGGYVIAAGSDNYSVHTQADIQAAPDALIELVNGPQRKERVDNGEGVGEGGRNDYLTRVAGKLQRLGLSQAAIAAAVHSTNESECNPPLDDTEVELIIESISRYTPDEDLKPKNLLVRADSLISSALERLTSREMTEGESTGYSGLDELLGGGLQLGRMYVLNAPAKTGKNILLHNIIGMMIKRGVKVGYASRELDPETDCIPQIASAQRAVNVFKKIKNGEEIGEKEITPQGVENLFFTPGYGYIPKEDLLHWFTQAMAEGVKHFFIDHTHYLLEDPEEWREMSRFVRDLKALAKEKEITVFIIIQPPNIDETVVQLGKHTLRGGAAAGQALDVLITMRRERDDNGNKTDISILTVAENRLIMGKEGRIHLQYNHDTLQLIEVEEIAFPNIG